MNYKIIAGPCVIESAELLDEVAQTLVQINRNLGTDIIFKASFDKANRTSISSYRGPGMEKGIQMLADVPSREVLLGRLLGSMQSPIANFARVIKQIAEKDGEAAAPAAEEAPAAE